MTTDFEDRIRKLESHLAEVEYLYEQLNKVVIEQGDTIRKLQQQNQKLAATMETVELDRIRMQQQKPPHYQ